MLKGIYTLDKSLVNTGPALRHALLTDIFQQRTP